MRVGGDGFVVAGSEIVSGDVRVMTNGEVRRLVLVLSLPRGAHAIVCLVHPYEEYATSSDIVLRTEMTSMRFNVVIEPVFRLAALFESLGELVLRVSDDVVDVANGKEGSGVLERGTCYLGSLDAGTEFTAVQQLAEAYFETAWFE